LQSLDLLFTGIKQRTEGSLGVELSAGVATGGQKPEQTDAGRTAGLTEEGHHEPLGHHGTGTEKVGERLPDRSVNRRSMVHPVVAGGITQNKAEPALGRFGGGREQTGKKAGRERPRHGTHQRQEPGQEPKQPSPGTPGICWKHRQQQGGREHHQKMPDEAGGSSIQAGKMPPFLPE